MFYALHVTSLFTFCIALAWWWSWRPILVATNAIKTLCSAQYVYISFFQLFSFRQWGVPKWFLKQCLRASQPLDITASPRSFIEFSRRENLDLLSGKIFDTMFVWPNARKVICLYNVDQWRNGGLSEIRLRSVTRRKVFSAWLRGHSIITLYASTNIISRSW